MNIPLDRLEEVIDARILERGQDYFDSGAVDEPEELEPGLYEAIVEGSDDYTVRVRLKGNSVTEHHCDCPYDLGPVCKHVVALLLDLRDNVFMRPAMAEGKKATKKPTVAQQVDSALSAVPHNELASFVRERCMADAAFRQQFFITCAPQTVGGDRKDHLKQIRSGLRAVAGRGGYFGWNETFAAAAVLHDMLGQADSLIKKGHAPRALPMIDAVIEGGAEAMENADDSNGDIGGAITSAMELLANLAEATPDEPFRRELLAGIQRMLADEAVSNCDWNGLLEPAAAALVRTGAEAAPLMASLKRSAAKQYFGSAARNALLDLARRFQGEAAADALEDSFMVHTDVRQRVIEAAIKAKDWPRARQLAEAGRQVMHDGRPATHAHYWTPYLLRIAQLTKDTPEVVRLARVLVVDNDNNAMEHYKLLREHVPAGEWKSFVYKLLGDLRKSARGYNHALIASICAAEERWGEVMALASDEGANPFMYHSMLDEYEQELAQHYPEEVATMLAERAEAHASRPNPKRDDYVQATKLLRRIQKLGDRQLVDALATDWRARLARRKGLMEELGKL